MIFTDYTTPNILVVEGSYDGVDRWLYTQVTIARTTSLNLRSIYYLLSAINSQLSTLNYDDYYLY
jgi:hypothetical protein